MLFLIPSVSLFSVRCRCVTTVWVTETIWKRARVRVRACVRLPCRRSHTRGGMIVFQAALPLPVFPELERFDLPTFIFVLTFLKNLATLWEVWLDGSCGELKAAFWRPTAFPLLTSIPSLARSTGRGALFAKTGLGKLMYFCLEIWTLPRMARPSPASPKSHLPGSPV